MINDRSLYDLIEEYVYFHEPCYQTDILRHFGREYSRLYITKACYKLWEDARIHRVKSGSTYIITACR